MSEPESKVQTVLTPVGNRLFDAIPIYRLRDMLREEMNLWGTASERVGKCKKCKRERGMTRRECDAAIDALSHFLDLLDLLDGGKS